MVFLSGPRQVGKTTLAKAYASTFLSWDDPDDRATILKGNKAVAEVASNGESGEGLVRNPSRISDDKWKALLAVGGFPEPLSIGSVSFWRRWSALRLEQLLRQGLRDLSRTVEIDQIETLARILALRSGSLLVYASLANDIAASEPTVKRWTTTLRALYYGFTVKPWFIAEVKTGDHALSPALAYFQKATGARHAFQVCLDLPYVDANCFDKTTPIVVPARTFLSQLL